MSNTILHMAPNTDHLLLLPRTAPDLNCGLCRINAEDEGRPDGSPGEVSPKDLHQQLDFRVVIDISDVQNQLNQQGVSSRQMLEFKTLLTKGDF
jgi:hypothetical protein